MYDAVTSIDKPNFLGAQVPVQHALNIQAWKKYQHLLEDQTLVPMLEFGFPVGYMGSQPPDTQATNHSSATNFPDHVDKFIRTELKHEAIMGPFENSPFSPWYRTNPLMTRPKRDSQDRRVILDLSYPEGASVNAQIPSQSLLDAAFKLRLPTPKQLADRILTLGPGCHLFKIDLSRAYRQLRSDPRDWPFLGINWARGRYVDAAIPFGLRHGASACQRTSEAVSTITFHKCQAVTLPYVDDTAGSSLPHQSQAHYRGTLETMDELGLQVAPAKCQAPSTEMEWIGVNYNTVDMTMQIAPAKVAEAAGMCRAFLASISMTRHEMQSFMGRVLHATKCTTAARRFTNRLLDFLRSLPNRGEKLITHEARLDTLWLATFLRTFNGLTLIKPPIAGIVAFVDACPEGIGGYCPTVVYYAQALPHSFQQLHFSISSIECFNLLVGARRWIQAWRGQVVLLFSDNWAAVCAANSGRASDPLIRASIRELWWLCAYYDVELVIRHRPGAEMQDADTLSRAFLSQRCFTRFREWEGNTKETRMHLLPMHLAPPARI